MDAEDRKGSPDCPEVIAEMTIDVIKTDLEEIKADVKHVQHALKQLAVQDNRLLNLERQVEAAWRKHDELKNSVDILARHEASCPRGVVSDLQHEVMRIGQYQASCPRRQVATLWLVVIPQSLVLIGIGIALLGH